MTPKPQSPIPPDIAAPKRPEEKRRPQKRTLETRARLLETAQRIVAQGGFEALRIEDVVQQAGVAKGTFFAHFKDKDALMDLLLGAKIDATLDPLEVTARVEDIAGLVALMMPTIEAVICERYVFDVVVRLSGALAQQETGAISHALYRQTNLLAALIAKSPFRKDAAPELLAEGVQALLTQAMAQSFCALHQQPDLRARLSAYLEVWLGAR